MDSMDFKKCCNCNKEGTELHHIVPLSLGGKDIDTNKVLLCSQCHSLIHGFNIETRGTHWKELQKRGIERAKKQGKYKGGTPKKVAQYDLKGNFIKEYFSLTEAAIAVSRSSSAISRAIKRQGTSGGYKWKYI